MNAKAKGSRREREVRDLLKVAGYDVVKGGGSLGVFDLVCVLKKSEPNLEEVILIQVKSNRIGLQEISEIAQHETTGCKQIWIKKDRKPWKYARIEDGE